MANSNQSAIAARKHLPYSVASMLGRVSPEIREESGKGQQYKGKASVDQGDGRSPIFVENKEEWNDPRFTPQLYAHELTHIKQNNLPPALQKALPPDNPSDPYNYGGAEGLRKVGGDPMKLSREQQGAAMQYLTAQRQGGAKYDPIYNTFEQKFGELPLSTVEATSPNQKGINTKARTPGLPSSSVAGMGKLYAGEKYKAGGPEPGAGPWEDYAPKEQGGAPWEDYAAPTAVQNGKTQDASFEPEHQISAMPSGPESWIQRAEGDLRYGGRNTAIGRALGYMQGRGDKGYTGLQSGTTPATADLMGSVPLGLTKALKGAVQSVTGKPLEGVENLVSGGLQTATIPSAFMGGPAVSSAAEMIPSRAAAGRAFEEVMQAAGQHPVNLTASSEPLTRVYELAQRGTSLPQAAGKLLRRVTDPEQGPLTYKEARDFASNLSRLSSNEAQRLNPSMKRAVAQLSHAFNQDVGQTAHAAGKGSEYAQAMKEYAKASQLRNAGIWAAKRIGIPAAAAAGLGAGAKLAWDLGVTR